MPFADVDVMIPLGFQHLWQHDFRIGHPHVGISGQVVVQFFMIDGWIRRRAVVMRQA